MNKIKSMMKEYPVINGYIIICLVCLVTNMVTFGAFNNYVLALPGTLISIPCISYKLVTYIFGHSGIQHFLNNMLMLVLTGPTVEKRIGSKKLIICMLITAIATGIVNGILFKTGLVGASGVVYMLIMMMLLTGRSVKQLRDIFKYPFSLIAMVYYFGSEIISAFVVNDNISHFAHLFGGICGVIMAIVINKRGSVQ